MDSLTDDLKREGNPTNLRLGTGYELNKITEVLSLRLREGDLQVGPCLANFARHGNPRRRMQLADSIDRKTYSARSICAFCNLSE